MSWKTRTHGNGKQVGQRFQTLDQDSARECPKQYSNSGSNPTCAPKELLVQQNVHKTLTLTSMDCSFLPEVTGKLDEAKVKEYMDDIAQGKSVSPIVVHKKPDGSLELKDGRHRLSAYRRLNVKDIPVILNDTVLSSNWYGDRILETDKKAYIGMASGGHLDKIMRPRPIHIENGPEETGHQQ
jgi:hypothetical protein